MKNSLAPGLTKTMQYEIDTARTVDFIGDEARVYATPWLLRDIEETCRQLLLEHLDEGEESVGTHIDLTHLAATPLGMTVEITATVKGVDGRKVSLDIEARDPVEVAARCSHERFIVDLETVAQRLKKKLAKAG